MRVISQDGTVDTPYGLSMIWIREKYGYSVMANMPNDDPVGLGKYSSREKALKAMEMCRKRYAIAEYNRRIIPKGDTPVMETAKELLTSGFIFQFPQDDEIEV